ncbi:MAG: hypothetical protein K8T89_08235 [Planctomycetes bacterium]|nr:hypothetical protein [Planctomycetota bacterium]
MGDDIILSQQMEFDQKLADFRTYYFELDPDHRKDTREWLEQTVALWSKCPLDMTIRLIPEYDVTDEAGEVIRWADCEFTPSTMLQAIKAWDEGETLTPDTMLP